MPTQYYPYGLIHPSRRHITNPVNRDTVTFTTSGMETNSSYTLITVQVLPGGGVPLHQHLTYSETFSTLSGLLHVTINPPPNSQLLILRPGESQCVKPGEWHCFNHPDPDVNSKAEGTVFTAKTEPASQGFEMLLAITYGMAADGLGDREGVAKNKFDALWMLAMSDMTMDKNGKGNWWLMRLAGVCLMVAEWTGRKDYWIRRYYGVPVEEVEEVRRKGIEGGKRE